MPELVKEISIKKTRKDHRCHGCREVIPGKSPAVSSTVKDGKELYTLYFCLPCDKFLREFPDYCCDPYGDVLEGAIAEGMKLKAEDEGGKDVGKKKARQRVP